MGNVLWDLYQHPQGDSSAKLDRAQSATSELSETDLLAKIEAEMGIGNDTKDIDIVVDNPEKLVKTMESYIAFSVKTKVIHCHLLLKV